MAGEESAFVFTAATNLQILRYAQNEPGNKFSTNSYALSGRWPKRKTGEPKFSRSQSPKFPVKVYRGAIVAPIGKFAAQPVAAPATAVPSVSFITTFVWSLQNVLWPVEAAVMGVPTTEYVPLGAASVGAPGER
jgi:hypothetical protein